MNRSQKITAAVGALAIAGLLALAAPPVVAAASWATERLAATPQPGAEPTPTKDAATGDDGLADDHVDVGNSTAIAKNTPAGCAEPRWVSVGNGRAEINGDLIDRGVNDAARGTVGLDADGRIKTYTVAAGDALYAIGDRFCIANPLNVATLNHTRTIQPGETLLLAPVRSIPWVEYYNPRSAEAGYQQIPYQLAVEKMSTAAWAGDIDRMRDIFENELRALFPDPAEADPIAKALEAGDLDVLRQMFA